MLPDTSQGSSACAAAAQGRYQPTRQHVLADPFGVGRPIHVVLPGPSRLNFLRQSGLQGGRVVALELRHKPFPERPYAQTLRLGEIVEN